MVDTNTVTVFAELEARRATLPSVDDLDADTRQSFWRDLNLRVVHTSIAMEGNTLSLHEVADVLEKNQVVPNKTLIEHLEAYNLNHAIDLMNQKAAIGDPITLKDIYELHAIVMRGIRPDAGQCRQSKIVVLGASTACIPPEDVPEEMRKFGEWLQGAPMSLETAFKAHLWLVDIHPFSDCNGRTARLLTNLILSRAGYLPVAVDPQDRRVYSETIQSFCESGNAEPFFYFMGHRLLKSYDRLEAVTCGNAPLRPSERAAAVGVADPANDS